MKLKLDGWVCNIEGVLEGEKHNYITISNPQTKNPNNVVICYCFETFQAFLQLIGILLPQTECWDHRCGPIYPL